VPALAIQLMFEANLEPLEQFPGSQYHWKCRCLLCGNIVNPKYTDIQAGSGGCKYCGGHFVDPEAARKTMISSGLIPQSEYVNSGTKWHCRCATCHRDVFPTYNSVQQGGGCAYCARIKVDPKDAVETMLRAGVTPQVPYPGSRVGWHSICKKCNREVFPFYSNVKHNNANACLYCAGKKVDGVSAFQLMENAGLTPLEEYERADTPWRCICNNCNKLVTPTYTAIRIGQGGCRYCTNKGLDYAASAFLYLMVNLDLGASKLGVGNHKTRVNRIQEHTRNGWSLEYQMDFETGDFAFEVEQRTLLWIRTQLHLEIFLKSSQMPQGGYTETFEYAAIEPSGVWDEVKNIAVEINRKISGS
jgi:hypothetical protein